MAITVAPSEPAPLKVLGDCNSVPEGFRDRFWDKIDVGGRDECWLWMARRTPDGYGLFYLGRRNGKDLIVTSNRFALELDDGIVIPGWLDACHSCDVPPCCNPNHLYVGTRKQNVADRYQRRRDLVGEDHPYSRLTNRQIVEIRVRAKKESTRSLALEFGVSAGWMRKIIIGSGRRYG